MDPRGIFQKGDAVRIRDYDEIMADPRLRYVSDKEWCLGIRKSDLVKLRQRTDPLFIRAFGNSLDDGHYSYNSECMLGDEIYLHGVHWYFCAYMLEPFCQTDETDYDELTDDELSTFILA